MGQIRSSSVRAGLRRHITPLDVITAGYVAAFMLGVLVFGRSHPSWRQTLLTNCAVLVAIIGIVWRWGEQRRGVTGFLRNLYPALLYPLFYSQMQVAVHWLLPRFLDGKLIAFEQAVFGTAPNLWLIRMQSPVLNEWMMLGYFSYYLLIPILVLPLHFKGRTDDVRRILTAATITFVISYIGFVVYPVEGPRYFLASRFAGPLEGRVFVPLVNWIIAGGAIHGGCMPSSHTAVALVILLWARRTNHRLAVWLAPFVFTIFAATVWGRFHYVSDVVVGWIVGAAGLLLADMLDGPGREAAVLGTTSVAPRKTIPTEPVLSEHGERLRVANKCRSFASLRKTRSLGYDFAKRVIPNVVRNLLFVPSTARPVPARHMPSRRTA